MGSEVNMDYLYKGLGYEYYTASQLWRMGYEAFKMDADFGFDIMAYNQREKSFTSSKTEKLYLFQVKSCCVYGAKTILSRAGKRVDAEVKFKLGEKELKHLLNEEKGYLVCYFVQRTEKGREKVLGEFWLNNRQLKFLSSPKNNFFKQDEKYKDKVYIKVRIQSKADPRCLWIKDLNTISEAITFLPKTEQVGVINEVSKKVNTLIININSASALNERSRTNVYLFPPEPDEKVRPTKPDRKILSEKQTDFMCFADDDIKDNPFDLNGEKKSSEC